MKQKLLLIAFLLFGLNLFAQTDPYIFDEGSTQEVRKELGGRILDSLLVIPVRGHEALYPDAPILGRFQLNANDSIPEYHNGLKWTSLDTIYERPYFEQISFDVNLPSGTPNHTSDTHNFIKDGVLYQVYRWDEFGSHVGVGSKIMYRTSTDQGETWTAGTQIYVDAVYDNRNYAVGVIGDRIIIFFRRSNPVDNTTHDLGFIYSDDDAATWSSYTTINPTLLSPATVTAPYGKIMTGNGTTFYVPIYSLSPNRCEWFKTTDGGDTWVSDGLKYDETIIGGEAAEPWYDFVSPTTVLALIRDEGDDPIAIYQSVSTDGGATFSTPVATNLGGGEHMKTGTNFCYDIDEDLILTAAFQRNRTEQGVDRIMYYANRLSEIISTPTNYRLISEAKPYYQSDLSVYGYPDIIKVAPNRYYLSYQERVPTGASFSTQSPRFVEDAFIYQLHIDTNIGNNPVAPTVKEYPRVQNYMGVWESRNPLNDSPWQIVREADEAQNRYEATSVFTNPTDKDKVISIVEREDWKEYAYFDKLGNYDSRGNITLRYDSGTASSRGIFLESDNSGALGWLRFISSTSSFNRLAPHIYGKSNLTGGSGLLFTGEPFSNVSGQYGLHFRVKRTDANATVAADVEAFKFTNWTTYVMKIMGNGNTFIGSANNQFSFDVANRRLGIGIEAPLSGLHVVQDGSVGAGSVIVDRFGTTNPSVSQRVAEGTLALPTAILSGRSLGAWTGQGHTGSAFATGFRLYTEATENWTPTAQGSIWRLRGIKTGSVNNMVFGVKGTGQYIFSSNLSETAWSTLGDKDASLTVIGDTSAGVDILNLENESQVSQFKFSRTGVATIVTPPTTSAGTYDLLTRNTSTGAIEKIASSTFAPVANPTFTTNVTSPKFTLSALNTAPSSATDTGTTGEIRIDAGYIYVCVATNTWVRSALTTW